MGIGRWTGNGIEKDPIDTPMRQSDEMHLPKGAERSKRDTHRVVGSSYVRVSKDTSPYLSSRSAT